MRGYVIQPDPLESEDVLALLAAHLEEMHAASPPDKVHALPPEKLRAPDVTFFTVRAGGTLAAVGALKTLGEGRGELKSMRAAPAFRGKGAGAALLDHLIAEARRRGYRSLGLETGATDVFADARALYERNGFRICPAFGEYVSDDFSLCMELSL